MNHGKPPEIDPELLLHAYGRGEFPMAEPETGEIALYNPDPRGVIPLEAFHVPVSLRRVVRSGRFAVTANTAFEEVMRACAAPRPGEDGGTWIDERLIRAYAWLHRLGCAHSLEAVRDGRLVGGLYGVHIGGAFFGESMFSRPEAGGTDASKVCLVHLVGWLRRCGFRLLDTQFITPHLERFGAVEISRKEYLGRLAEAIVLSVEWGSFDAGVARG